MTFLNRFLTAWRTAKAWTYTEAAEVQEFWTQEDSSALSHFFLSGTGQKLKVRLANYTIQQAVNATVQTSNLEYHCGHARGIADTVRTIELHGQISPVPAHRDQTEDSDRTVEFLERVGAT